MGFAGRDRADDINQHAVRPFQDEMALPELFIPQAQSDPDARGMQPGIVGIHVLDFKVQQQARDPAAAGLRDCLMAAVQNGQVDAGIGL